MLLALCYSGLDDTMGAPHCTSSYTTGGMGEVRPAALCYAVTKWGSWASKCEQCLTPRRPRLHESLSMNGYLGGECPGHVAGGNGHRLSESRVYSRSPAAVFDVL